MKLIDKINHLRLSAAFIFDVGRSQKHSSEQIAGNIKPLAEQLEKQMQTAPIGELVSAIKALEHQMEAHQLDVQFYQGKIVDCENHVANLKNCLMNQLLDKNLTQMFEDGHTLTLIDGNLNIR